MKKIQPKTQLIFTFILLVFFFLIGHLLYIDSPWVNAEYVFSEAARSFIESDYTIGLTNYWQKQANPLGQTFTIALVGKLFGIHYWSSRIPSLIGGVLILFIGFYYFRSKNKDERNNSLILLWLLVMISNPLFWIYSGQGTNDVLPVALVYLAFLFCSIAKGRTRFHLFAGILFSLSIINKFNCILLGLGFIYILFFSSKKEFQFNLKKIIALSFYTVLPLFVLIGYYLFIYVEYDIVILPEHFKKVHSFAVGNFISYFPNYLSFSGLLLGFLTLLAPLYYWKVLNHKKTWIPLTILLTIALAIALWTFYPIKVGEMDFGRYFDSYLTLDLIRLIKVSQFFSALMFFILIFIFAVKRQSSFARFLLLTIVPFVVISSFSRPAQRYLLFLMPLLAYFNIIELGTLFPKWTKRLSWLTIVAFATLTFMGVHYQNAQSGAEENMALWTKKQKILDKTLAERDYHHTYHHFLPYLKNKKSYVITTKNRKGQVILHQEDVLVFGTKIRSYFLYKIPSNSK